MKTYTLKDIQAEFNADGMSYLLASLFETYKLHPNDNFQIAITRAVAIIKSEPLLKNGLKGVINKCENCANGHEQEEYLCPECNDYSKYKLIPQFSKFPDINSPAGKREQEIINTDNQGCGNVRILGFSTKWDKLDNDLLFTTFRFARKDADKGRDWAVEETVQIFYKPRSPKREFLGIARIIRKEEKHLEKKWSFYPNTWNPNTPDMIMPDEAESDGFTGNWGGGDTNKMRDYFHKTYGWSKCDKEPIYKLTLYWIKKADKVEAKA